MTWEALSREFKACIGCLAQAEALGNALNYEDHAISVTTLSQLESCYNSLMLPDHSDLILLSLQYNLSLRYCRVVHLPPALPFTAAHDCTLYMAELFVWLCHMGISPDKVNLHDLPRSGAWPLRKGGDLHYVPSTRKNATQWSDCSKHKIGGWNATLPLSAPGPCFRNPLSSHSIYYRLTKHQKVFWVLGFCC